MPFPEWHKRELDKRLAAYEANPGLMKPWSEVRENILRKYEKLN
jgi:hypothetical protein